ncbi:MAG: glycoside hydrolase family 127 protein [Bacteroidales bacterium]
MNKLIKFIVVIASILLFFSRCAKKSSQGADYPIQPVPFTSVKLTDDFWAPRIKRNASVTIPIAFGYCESTGRVKNFDIAAGRDTGKFQTIFPFDDSDVYKIIEGASYSLQTFPDPGLEAYLDTLIRKIGLAQEPDGYLYTNRTIAEKHGGVGLHEWAGKNRWEMDSVLSHELYNLGHLYEAAVAHFQATGKRTLLDIALKSADLVNKDFGMDKVEVYPGHQVIEMGLVKLYRVTGEKKYLDLARFFLDIRGPKGRQYNQANLKPVDQTEAVGHSVRATYMYSGMADIAAIEKDDTYLNAITKIWENLVYGKMYLTGGIGATGGNEGFADPFILPNMSAYCETCASIGDIFFNQRLFLLHGQSKYIDILEKTLYNSMLSGVSLSADRFFYPNPLESKGQHLRQAWFGCACCPSNVARFVPAIPGYVYAITDNELYVNLFISNDANITLGNRKLRITQKANFPWDGKVEILVNPETNAKFILKMRIPGWAQNEALPGGLYKFTDQDNEPVTIKVNGKDSELKLVDGYAVISRKWKSGDKVEIEFPMPVRKVVADERIKEDKDKMAFQRGPVIYCAEWPDNNTGNVMDLVIKKDAAFTTEFEPSFLEGTEVIKTSGVQAKRTLDGKIETLQEEPLKLIPYALWNNRGAGQMMVWFPTSTQSAHPLPAPTIANRSKMKASKITKELSAINDQTVPSNSNDHSVSYYHWWPDKDKWEWVEYDFEKPETISKTKIYWYDDGPEGGCKIPDTWEILYLSGNMWESVKPLTPYKVTKDGWDSLVFNPVKASAIKIKVKLNKDFSSGIYEWIVE